MGNIFNDLTHFSLLMKLMKIVIFFHKDSINKESMETFCLSSVSQEILLKVMTNNFYLSIFYPKIPGITFERSIN